MSQKKEIEEIFELSQDFKKNALWNKLLDSEYFGVEFPDGQVGFVRIIGTDNQKALNIYLGNQALERIKYLYQRDYNNPFYDFENTHLKQDFIQISLDPVGLVNDEIVEDYNNYCQDNNIDQDQTFPNILRYKPYNLPDNITNLRELEYLKLALIAQNEVNKALTEKDKKELGIKPVYPGLSVEIPLLIFNDNLSITWDFIKIPELTGEEESLELIINEEYDNILEEVKKLEETLPDIVFFHYINDVVSDEEGNLKFPAYLTVAPAYGLRYFSDLSVEEQLPPLDVMVDPDKEKLEKELIELAQFYIDQQIKPKAIRTVDQRTFNLLKDFCQKTGINLKNGEKGSINSDYYRQLNSDILFNRLLEVFQDLEPGKPIQDFEKIAQREAEKKKAYEEFLTALEAGEISEKEVDTAMEALNGANILKDFLQFCFNNLDLTDEDLDDEEEL